MAETEIKSINGKTLADITARENKLDKNQGTSNAGKILGIGEDGIIVPQDKPTYTLPQATADALGGIKADAATAEDTQVVRIGTDGKLKTKPTGGSSITVDSELSSTSTNPVQNKVVTAALAKKITAPATAAVGQIIKVKSVDDAGKPTEWEAVDMPSSGSVTDEQVNTAVSAWLTEHPEATTTVADKSITREKMAFPAYEGALSPNLADPSAYTIARFISTSGGKQAFKETSAYADYWRMTDYIDVSKHIGEQLWATNWQGYCFYDADKTAISESGQFISSTSIELSKYSTEPITIPEGAAYIVLAFCYAKGKVDLMLNFGDALLPYVQYGDINLPDASVGDAQINGKLSLDKVDTAKLLLPTVGKNLVDKSQMIKDKIVNNTGAIVDTNTSLVNYYVGNIKVTGGADYLVYAKNVVFFDIYGNVCGSDGVDTYAYRKIKAPISAVSCVVNGGQYADAPSNIIHNTFMVEGSVLPEKVVCEKNYGEKTIEPNIIGKSVLHRMEDCWNPSTKTVIGLCGDSNTRGIIGNGDVTQNPNCWANLVTAEILNKCSGERHIYPYGDIGVWGCTSYNNREPQTRHAGVIKIPFYGTSIGLVWGSLAGVVDFNVTIDDGETTVTTVPDTGYTWDGLTEGYHTITLEWAAAEVCTISHFVVNKTIEVINRGISGRNFEGINADLNVTGDTVDIICYGTNNRKYANINDASVMEMDYFEYLNRDTELIYMSPIPALDSIEEANEPWKTIPYIESFIAGREARHNREYISLYHEIKDYCAMNNVELTSLYVDGLHLNDEGHKVVAKILCRKLGLGDLSE